MNNIQAFGELLTASEEGLSLTYKLLPYGEDGSTSAGVVKASQGILTLPDDVASLSLNEEHDFKRPIGFFESLIEEETGLTASVRLIDTQAGRDAHKLAKAGLRTGISVEISEPIIRNGNLLAGRLTGAGLVVRPAFANALLIAADCGTTTKESNMENLSTLEAAEDISVAPADTFVQAAPLLAGASTPTSFGAIALAAAPEGAEALTAALAQFKTTNDAGKAYLKDQEVELWEAHKSERPIVNSVTNKPLTSLVLTGTRKTRTVAVADWAGNLVELPTATYTTSREFFNAKAKAVAVELAMEVLEFGSEDIINEIYSQAVNSYIEQTETELLTKIGGETTAVSGVSGVVAAVDYASQALGNIGASMSTIVVSADVYSKLLALKTADAPFWFAGQASVNLADSSANAGGISFRVGAGLPAQTVLVYDKRAIQFYESPEFRQRAVNVTNGGVTVNLIKFNASYISDPAAILRFSNVTAV